MASPWEYLQHQSISPCKGQHILWIYKKNNCILPFQGVCNAWDIPSYKKTRALIIHLKILKNTWFFCNEFVTFVE